MDETVVGSPRERYRQQVREEIKAHAWAQVATTGASALSLNAIAKLMGVSGPALYRYYRSRDELITELVLDAYRDVVGTCQDAAARGTTANGRLAAAATALRGWAVAAPHRYLLIFGTPVPGYAAPPETTAILVRLMVVMLDAFAEAEDESEPPADGPPDGPVDRSADLRGVPATTAAVEADLAVHRGWAGGHPASPAVLRRALTFWTRLHGVISLELAGHFEGMAFDPALLYAEEVDAAVRRT